MVAIGRVPSLYCILIEFLSFVQCFTTWRLLPVPDGWLGEREGVIGHMYPGNSEAGFYVKMR